MSHRTLRAVAAAAAVVAVAALAALAITLHLRAAAVTAGSAPGETGAASALAPAISLPPLTDPEPGPLPLHVDGKRLVNSAGTSVVLHGADMSGTEFVCVQGWTDDPFGGQPEDDPATFAAMKSWGITAVRIPLNEDCWLGINGVHIGGNAYQQPIIKLVRDLEADGFYVILDLHWSAPGTQLAVTQNPAPDEDHSPAFWSGVAATFQHDPGVLFDLYNEPYFYSTWMAPGAPDPWTCLWTGCEMVTYVTGGNPYQVNRNWKTAGFTQLTHDIRNAGASNVIMAAGEGWAQDMSGWLSSLPADMDPNTVASWHSYPGSGCGGPSCWDSTIAPIAAKYPVIIGETGDSSAGPVTYMNKLLPWADSHGIGYLAWTWNAWGNPTDVLVTSMAAGTPTAGEGAYYRKHLQSLG
ncbi:MAG: cellulase family glycosylhydrolase [Candidatus Dormibacteria bacterium]